MSDRFEKGVGVVLRNAWAHVEALQTTEVPIMCSHIAEVLRGISNHAQLVQQQARAGDLHQRQEVLVYYYLADILTHLEEIREDR